MTLGAPGRSSFNRFALIRERLRRITSGGEYSPEVDGVRFLAISLVLLQHVYERVSRPAQKYYLEAGDESAGWLFSQGDFGVQLFFALSGLVLFRGLCRLAANRRGYEANYRQYLWRRVTRLEPPYLLVMTGVFLFLSLTGYQSDFSKTSQQGDQSLTQSFGASLVYGHGLIFGGFPKLNPPTWSLETEFQFYIIAPLLVWSLRKGIRSASARLIALLSVLISLCLWVVPTALQHPHFRYSLGVYLPLFVVGFLAGEVSEWISRRDDRRQSRGVILDVVGILCGALLTRLSYVGPEKWSGISYCILMLGLLVGCVSGALLRGLLSWGFIPVIGGMCYSIYLIHLPIMQIVAGLTYPWGRGLPYGLYVSLHILFLLSITLTVATVFYLLVERPCMNRQWPSRLWSRLMGRRLTGASVDTSQA